MEIDFPRENIRWTRNRSFRAFTRSKKRFSPYGVWNKASWSSSWKRKAKDYYNMASVIKSKEGGEKTTQGSKNCKKVIYGICQFSKKWIRTLLSSICRWRKNINKRKRKVWKTNIHPLSFIISVMSNIKVKLHRENEDKRWERCHRKVRMENCTKFHLHISLCMMTHSISG